tara:strand:- start:14173 stop:14907 length:735 start_codon:yes stop_codon:yes gene_type:complete
VSLVTGGNRGIGKFISLSLAEEGSSVAVHYNQDKKGAESVVKEIRESGGNAEVFQADVSQRGSVEKMIKNCSQSLGQIDVLVNNARQLVKGREFMDLEWDKDYQPHIDVMLKGTFNCCQVVLPSMIERKNGRIINMLSTVIAESRPRTNSYGSIKSALFFFSKNLATEMGPNGITVNMVSPGLIATERQILHSSGYQEDYINETPMGRLGIPSDITGTINFLASDNSSFVTGANIPVSGGKTIF